MTVNDTQDYGIHSDQSDATVSASDSDDELLMNTNRFKVVKKAGRNKKLESSSTNNDLPPENPTPVVEKEDLEFLRFKSHYRLKNSWDNIIEKYGKVFENDDEIDIKSQQIIVDNGMIRKSRKQEIGLTEQLDEDVVAVENAWKDPKIKADFQSFNSNGIKVYQKMLQSHFIKLEDKSTNEDISNQKSAHNSDNVAFRTTSKIKKNSQSVKLFKKKLLKKSKSKKMALANPSTNSNHNIYSTATKFTVTNTQPSRDISETGLIYDPSIYANTIIPYDDLNVIDCYSYPMHSFIEPQIIYVDRNNPYPQEQYYVEYPMEYSQAPYYYEDGAVYPYEEDSGYYDHRYSPDDDPYYYHSQRSELPARSRQAIDYHPPRRLQIQSSEHLSNQDLFQRHESSILPSHAELDHMHPVVGRTQHSELDRFESYVDYQYLNEREYGSSRYILDPTESTQSMKNVMSRSVGDPPIVPKQISALEVCPKNDNELRSEPKIGDKKELRLNVKSETKIPLNEKKLNCIDPQVITKEKTTIYQNRSREATKKFKSTNPQFLDDVSEDDLL
ncbi:hypothetical protein BC833DRAFT_618247 [Globomyces pollinis-pini]|nr:hypothetical protein BC833DRAFT_618247 [Globomyces pollinis-pini]